MRRLVHWNQMSLHDVELLEQRCVERQAIRRAASDLQRPDHGAGLLQQGANYLRLNTTRIECDAADLGELRCEGIEARASAEVATAPVKLLERCVCGVECNNHRAWHQASVATTWANCEWTGSDSGSTRCFTAVRAWNQSDTA